MVFAKQLIQWLLGVPLADPGQGTEWSVRANWPGPTWMIVIGAAVAAAVNLWLYRQDAPANNHRRTLRAVLVTLRWGVLALLLFAISQTMLMLSRTGLPVVAVLVDISESMATEDHYSDPDRRRAADALSKILNTQSASRLDLAKDLLLRERGEVLQRLQAHHQLKVYTVAESVAPLVGGGSSSAPEFNQLLTAIRRLQPLGDQTRLGAALRSLLNELRGTPPAAMIVISDGNTTDGEKLSAAARLAAERGVPVYSIAIGNISPQRDLELHDVLADEIAFANDPLVFAIGVTGHGFEGKKTAVRLKDKASGEVLASKELAIRNDGERQSLELTFTPTDVGEFDFVVEVEPLPKKGNHRNNQVTKHVSVRQDKLRVLLVDQRPRWEYRELKALFEREKTVDLKTVLMDADPEFAEEDRFALAHLPVRKAEINEFDVIIFGDVDAMQVNGQTAEFLRDFVRERGGGIVFIAGARNNPASYRGTPLESLLPIELADTAEAGSPAAADDFRLELTPEAVKGNPIFRLADDEPQSRQIWNRLPPMHWMYEATDTKPAAVVLASVIGSGRGDRKVPVIAMQRYGAGKVWFHATDETWQWRFRQGDAYFGRYWNQVVRFLSRSSQPGQSRTAELLVDRREYQRGETVRVTVRFLDDRAASPAPDEVAVIVERAGGEQRRVQLTRVGQTTSAFEGEVSGLAEGSYRAWLAAPAMSGTPPAIEFQVILPQQELRVTRLDLAELQQAARLTGGQVFTVAEADQLPDRLPLSPPVTVAVESQVSLWNHWLVLALVLLLLTTEWLVRKRARLL